MSLSMQLDWQLINSFSGWFSAAGTILAVAFSLYVSFSTRSIKIAVTSNIYVLNKHGEDIEYLGIFVQNVGFRAFYINNHSCISLRVGWFKKRYIGIGSGHIDFTKSTNFPCKLGEGEQAKLFVRLHDEKSCWIDGLKNELFKGSSVTSLRVIVFPSIGKHVVRRFDKKVIREFKKI